MVWLIVAGCAGFFLLAYRRSKTPYYVFGALIAGGAVAGSGLIFGEAVALLVCVLIWIPGLFFAFVLNLLLGGPDDMDFM